MQSACYRRLGLGKVNPAWSNVLSGFAVQVVLGALYLWGNITPITTSFLRKYDPSLTYNDTLFVYIVSLAFNGIFVMFSGYFQNTFGPRWCVAVGGYLMCFSALLTSYCTSLLGFIFTQGAMYGAGFGISYSASFTCAIKWLPERKALLTGLVISGVGCGTSAFSNYAMRFLNPDNVPIGSSGETLEEQHYYPPDSSIPGRVPEFYFNLSMIYFALITIGVLFCYPYDKDDPYFQTIIDDAMLGDDDKHENIAMKPSSPTRAMSLESELDTKALLDTKPKYRALNKIDVMDIGPKDLPFEPMAYVFEMCMVCTNVGGMYIAGVFKNMGESHFKDEVFLTAVGTYAALSNTISRLCVGALADRYGPLRTLFLLNIILSTVLVSYAYTPYVGEEAYALSTCTIQFILGANLCVYPAACIVLFGGTNGGGNYGVFYSIYNGMIVIVTSFIWMYNIDIFISTLMLGIMCLLGTIGVYHLSGQLPAQTVSSSIKVF